MSSPRFLIHYSTSYYIKIIYLYKNLNNYLNFKIFQLLNLNEKRENFRKKDLLRS